MTTTELRNDIINVTASFDETGHTVPKSVRWQENNYTLTGVGRQWDSDEGRHILVESATGERFEIQLSREDLLWRLKHVWREDFIV